MTPASFATKREARAPQMDALIDINTVRRGWGLLSAKERRRAGSVMVVIVLAALSAAAMVFSILPFFSALSRPDYIREQAGLAWLYKTLGFSSDFRFIEFLGGMSIAVIVASNLLQFLRLYMSVMFSKMQMHSISSRLLERYLCQPYEYFLNLNSSTASSHVLAQPMQAVNTFYYPMVDMIGALATSVTIISLLLWISPITSLVSFSVIAGTYTLILFFLRKRISVLGIEQHSATKKRFRAANEALTGAKDIKILGREKTYSERYSTQSESLARAQAHITIMGGIPQYFMQIITFGGLILLSLILLGPETLAEGSSLAEIVPLLGFFALAGQKLIPEMQRVYGALVQLRSAGPIIDALAQEFTETANGSTFSDPHAQPMGMTSSLRFEDVSYRYPGSETNGVQNISFEIEAGMSLGIIGRSGAGKTTLADLVLGLLRPTGGQLVVDGTPVTEKNLRSWQRTLGYVPQAIFLQDATISENIALGVPEAQRDEARVRRAAGAAQLDGFIATNLPDGYATPVGDRGVKLSGGQRQRIGIARALYHDASVMVFDEATSALDTATEQDLMAAISDLVGKKTIIIIAHRLSTVRDCDRIAVFEAGRLAGFGTWEELEGGNEAFRRIARQPEVA